MVRVLYFPPGFACGGVGVDLVGFGGSEEKEKKLAEENSGLVLCHCSSTPVSHNSTRKVLAKMMNGICRIIREYFLFCLSASACSVCRHHTAKVSEPTSNKCLTLSTAPDHPYREMSFMIEMHDSGRDHRMIQLRFLRQVQRSIMKT